MEADVPCTASCTHRGCRIPCLLDVGARLRKVSRLRVTPDREGTDQQRPTQPTDRAVTECRATALLTYE